MRNSRCKIITLIAGMIGIMILSALGNTNVLFDDFNDGNFAAWTVNKGSWTVVNGTLVGHETWPALHAYVYTGNSNWNDIIFETDVIFQSESAELMIRSTGHWTNEYRLELYSQGAEAYANRFFLWNTIMG